MITLLLLAKDIPIGSIVKAKDDTLPHILMDDVKIITNGTTYEDKEHPDCLFMMIPGDITSIKAINPEVLLRWSVYKEEQLKSIIDNHL